MNKYASKDELENKIDELTSILDDIDTFGDTDVVVDCLLEKLEYVFGWGILIKLRQKLETYNMKGARN